MPSQLSNSMLLHEQNWFSESTHSVVSSTTKWLQKGSPAYIRLCPWCPRQTSSLCHLLSLSFYLLQRPSAVPNSQSDMNAEVRKEKRVWVEGSVSEKVCKSETMNCSIRKLSMQCQWLDSRDGSGGTVRWSDFTEWYRHRDRYWSVLWCWLQLFQVRNYVLWQIYKTTAR